MRSLISQVVSRANTTQGTVEDYNNGYATVRLVDGGTRLSNIRVSGRVMIGDRVTVDYSQEKPVARKNAEAAQECANTLSLAMAPSRPPDWKINTVYDDEMPKFDINDETVDDDEWVPPEYDPETYKYDFNSPFGSGNWTIPVPPMANNLIAGQVRLNASQAFLIGAPKQYAPHYRRIGDLPWIVDYDYGSMWTASRYTNRYTGNLVYPSHNVAVVNAPGKYVCSLIIGFHVEDRPETEAGLGITLTTNGQSPNNQGGFGFNDHNMCRRWWGNPDNILVLSWASVGNLKYGTEIEPYVKFSGSTWNEAQTVQIAISEDGYYPIMRWARISPMIGLYADPDFPYMLG